MSTTCALFLVALCAMDERLDQARVLIGQGLLHEAERILVPLIETSGPADRARVVLLLGNVDYERGLYDKALENYIRAENDGAADGATAAAARANRSLAEERLQRGREISRLERRLRATLAACLALAVTATVWLARRPRSPSPERRRSVS